MRRFLRSRAGRTLIGFSLTSFISSLVIGPWPAEAGGKAIQDGLSSWKGQHRRLTPAEMKSIQGGTSGGSGTTGAVRPWGHGDPNAGGYGDWDNINGNETITIPVVGYQGRGLSIDFKLTWNSLVAANFDPSLAPYPGNPCGVAWTHSYNLYCKADGSNNVTVTEGDAGTEFYTYSAGSLVPPAGIHDSLVKNGDGSYTLTRHNQVQLHFSASVSDPLGLHCDTITDPNSNQIVLAYSSFTIGGQTYKQVTTVTDPTSRVLTLAYTANRVSSITDPASRVWNLSYDANDNLSQVSTPRIISGIHTAYNLTYDATNVYTLTKVKDRRGNQWTLAWSGNNLTSVSDPNSNSRSYSKGTSTFTITDENGNKTQGTFDTSNRVTAWSVIFSGSTYSQVLANTWDSSNNCTAREDGDLNTWSFTWDSNGNKLTEVTPSSKTTTWTFNSHNDCTSVTTPLNYQTTMAYNSTDNLTTVTDALTHTVVYGYDTGGHGMVVSITDPNSHAETIGHDSNGLVNSVTDADSKQTQYVWNSVS